MKSSCICSLTTTMSISCHSYACHVTRRCKAMGAAKFYAEAPEPFKTHLRAMPIVSEMLVDAVKVHNVQLFDFNCCVCVFPEGTSDIQLMTAYVGRNNNKTYIYTYMEVPILYLSVAFYRSHQRSRCDDTRLSYLPPGPLWAGTLWALSQS